LLGLFVTGGLTTNNIDLITDPAGPFMPALLDKGRLSGVLKRIPVYVVKIDDLGERGAHWVAVQDLMSQMQLVSCTPLALAPMPTTLKAVEPTVAPCSAGNSTSYRAQVLMLSVAAAIAAASLVLYAQRCAK